MAWEVVAVILPTCIHTHQSFMFSPTAGQVETLEGGLRYLGTSVISGKTGFQEQVKERQLPALVEEGLQGR